jgi:hypothetical protein
MVLEELKKIKIESRERFLKWVVLSLISIKSEEKEKYSGSVINKGRGKYSLPQQGQQMAQIPQVPNQPSFSHMNPSLMQRTSLPQRKTAEFNPELSQQGAIRKVNVREMGDGTPIQQFSQMPQIPLMKNMQEIQQNQMRMMQPQFGMPFKVFTLSSLSDLLENPQVRKIEAIGGEKVKININNQDKILDLKISEEDIKNKIQEFSRKTKIPITEGFFEASINNLHVDAIVSDIISSRILIQKK